jgi:hypothetical protein
MKRVALVIVLAVLATAGCKKKKTFDDGPSSSGSTVVVTPAPTAPPVVTSTPTTPAPSLKAFPGTEAGAKALLAEFVKPGADAAGLSAQLRPSLGDYKALFDASLAA